MKFLYIAAIATIICNFQVDSKTGHAVFAPKYAEPAKTYSVNVLLTREAADTAVTSATVQASLNIAGLPPQQSTVGFSSRQLGANVTFRFAVPASLASGRFKLSVSSTGHITFNKQIDVTVQTVRGQIYVQMDKPMYRAGDKLRFIVFGLYNSFLPITDRSMNITLQDAKGNLVQRWTNVRNLTAHGVAQYELRLSSQASLGIWRLNITFGELSGFYTFPVEDYKLSYFEAVVTTNSTFFSRQDSNNAVEVVSEGRYQHHSCKSRSNCKTNERGQVTGRVELQVWLLGTGSTKYGSINVTQDVGLGNPAKYVITSAVLNSVVDINLIDRLLIYSKVTEFGTGFTNYANKTMTLIDRVYLLDYPKYINPTIFHTDRDLHLEMTAIKANGQPLSRSEITQLQYETAASCSADDFENEPLDSLLPSHSIGALVSTGIVKLTIHTTDEDLNCPEVFVKVNLQSKSKNPVVVFHSIFQRYTRFASDAQIKISWEDGKHEIRQKKVDDHISFHVDATTAVPVFHWMVVSRGLVFESGVFSEPDLQKETLRLNVSSEHMPRASILVWTTLNDELVADALEFLVVDNTVALDYSTGSSPATDNFGSNAVTQVRSPVALRFDTLPNSFVQWLAIDEKVLIHLQSKISASAVDQSELQGNNDFTPYSSQSLKQNFLDVSRQLVAHFDSLAGVHKDSAPNSYEVFKQSQIIVDTSYNNTNGLPKRSRRSVASYNSNNNAVRVLFPEVFLFENEIAPSSGVSEDTGLTSFIKRYTTPDTMTSWFAAALSVHPTRGLHVSNVVQIPVYHDFYLSIYIPTLTYKCNETVNATVYVHNTRDADVSATLTVSGSANYKAEGRDLNVSVSKNVFVPAKSVVITTFLLQFVVVGRPRIVISAVTSEGLKDALETYVNVKPEGVPVKLETPAFYCWTNTECSTNVVLEPKKECCTQPALGEVIGVITPVFMLPEDAGGENNTDNIPNPEGCCEQMMPDFTELSYLLQTLRRSNKTSPKVEAAATERLQVHLQQYLAKCARSDGSVTSWGNSEANLGSTVLTSFVARTLLVAADLLKDSGALEQAQRSIYWLLGHQEQDDGSFPSYPPNSGLSVPYVWYTQLESGPYADSIATAYTLIAILEQPSISKQFATSHYSKLLAASAYLKKHYGNTKDMHYLSITAYALQLAAMRLDDTQAQSVAAEIVNGLKRRAYSSNGLTFWPYERAPESCNSVITGRIPASASEVELASFISEYYYLNARVPEATPIFRFLLSQRNSQHKLPRMGASTHSTALGQQAIGDYLILANIPVAYSGTVKIQAVGGLSPFSETVVVYENSLTPIEIALPQGTPEVKVMTTAGLTQIYFKTVKYYPNPYHAYTSYRSGVLEIHVISSPTTEKADFATIKVCNSWNRNETSGMIVSMVELPSGFALHSTLQDIQKQHLTADGGSLVGSLEIQNDKNFAIYYNYIQSYKPTCTEVLLRRTINVDNLATAAVRSYNYYESQYIGFELYKLTREPHLPRHHQLDEL